MFPGAREGQPEFLATCGGVASPGGPIQRSLCTVLSRIVRPVKNQERRSTFLMPTRSPIRYALWVNNSATGGKERMAGRSIGPRQAYSFSFLAGALFVPESVALAQLWSDHPDWKEVVERAIRDNSLRKRTEASRTRILREIRYRLEQLTREEVAFLANAASRDQRMLLFIAVCLRFAFIREFVEEVLRPKLETFDFQISPGDFVRFFDQKAACAPEVDQLTEKSRAKVKQVIVRMLAEAGLIGSTVNRRLQRPVPSHALARLVGQTDPKRLRFLLLSDMDIRQHLL